MEVSYAFVPGAIPGPATIFVDRNAQRCAAGLLIRVSQVRSLIGQPIFWVFSPVMVSGADCKFVV